MEQILVVVLYGVALLFVVLLIYALGYIADREFEKARPLEWAETTMYQKRDTLAHGNRSLEENRMFHVTTEEKPDLTLH